MRGLWTIYQLFDVLNGEARSLTPEPLEDSVGIEFHKILADGARESHSVKNPDAGQRLDLGFSDTDPG